ELPPVCSPCDWYLEDAARGLGRGFRGRVFFVHITPLTPPRGGNWPGTPGCWAAPLNARLRTKVECGNCVVVCRDMVNGPFLNQVGSSRQARGLSLLGNVGLGRREAGASTADSSLSLGTGSSAVTNERRFRMCTW